MEYDVRDDEPEQTDVFRLESASRELVAEWIKQSFPHVSQVDRERIAEFSDGNFRVAGALAQTLHKGETLGSLKSRDLLERIFRQRNSRTRNCFEWLRISRFFIRSMEKISLTKANSPDWVVSMASAPDNCTKHWPNCVNAALCKRMDVFERSFRRRLPTRLPLTHWSGFHRQISINSA